MAIPVPPELARRIKVIRADFLLEVKADGMEARMIVLHDMLLIEGMIKKMFGPYLGIKKEPIDPTKPKQNKKKTIKDGKLPIGFEQMLQMFVHLDVIDDLKEYPKLNLFYLIRCQFVHNHEASSFTKCFELLGKDRKTELFKYYSPRKRWGEERQLENAVRRLGKDCRDIVSKVIEAYLVKYYDDLAKKQALKKYEFRAMQEASVHLFRAFTIEMRSLVTAGHQFDDEDIEAFPKHLYKYWRKDFNRELKSLLNTGKTREEIHAEKQEAKKPVLANAPS